MNPSRLRVKFSRLGYGIPGMKTLENGLGVREQLVGRLKSGERSTLEEDNQKFRKIKFQINLR